MTSDLAAQAAYAMIPVVSRESQRATLVIDTPADVSAWLNGKPVVLSANRRGQGEPRTALVDLPKGESRLLIRLTREGGANGHAVIATTFITDQPVGFESGPAATASGVGGQR